jgi:nitroreductase
MPTISGKQVVEQLQWRYATKVFDTERKISDDDWQSLEQALALSASSYGLQPWKFFVVTDSEIRDSLVEHSWNQRQVADASHLLVFAVNKQMTETDVDRYVDRVVEVRGGDAESLQGYRNMMVRDIVDGPRGQGEASTQWAKLQSYIALGNFMTAAALMGIDTCPMEGFVAEKYDEILGFEDRGLTTAVLCPAGYRAEDDKYADLPKVRFDASELIERI